MKIAWVANSHLQPTGYGIICKNVVQHIQHNSNHQMVEVAISGIQRTSVFDWDGVPVYGNSTYGGAFGAGSWPAITTREDIDLWMLNFDAWANDFGKLIPQISEGIGPYCIYPPIDHEPLSPTWLPVLRRAYDIVPYCQYGERVLREGLGLPGQVSHYIPHGFDSKHFYPKKVDRKKVFGDLASDDHFVVGIFKNNQGTRAKYPEQLEAFKMFINTTGAENARLYLHTSKTGAIGQDGRMAGADIVGLVKKLGLEGKVWIVGNDRYQFGLTEDELADTYNACDVILNCVSCEGWGLPITEAFACGKPVIATASSSMPELLSGIEGEIKRSDYEGGESYEVERGWLVPTCGTEFTKKLTNRADVRAEDIAAALIRAYENPTKCAEKGAAAHEWVQKWSWEKVGDMWIDYFDKIEGELEKKKKLVCEPLDVTEPVGKNKTACVVFSFNRPEYLAWTLDSLSKNTKADECDWFFYQDGWKNDEKYPYTDEKGEEYNREQVRICNEMIAEFPFKYKDITSKEYNVCIGKQLQEAKERLFKDYDNVIFFDDDHVVSKDYIELLLKMNEQYPDTIVGAQATEYRNIPVNATLKDVGITVESLDDRLAMAGRWRWLAYLLPKSVHEKTVKDMDEYMEFIGPSYRDIPHHAVAVKYGVNVTGFDGVMDSFCDKYGIKRVATVIPRGRYIGKKGLFGTPGLYEQMGFSDTSVYEFDESEVDEFKEYGVNKKKGNAHGHMISPDIHGRFEGADQWVTKIIKENVKENDVILDIGACIGYYSVLLGDLAGKNGCVHSFEPNPSNFSILKENANESNGNIIAINKAVSIVSGKANLYLSQSNLGDHRLYEANKDRHSVIVDVTTIDDYFGKDIQSVDFIKIDVQGAEIAALRGMKNVLDASPNAKILIEYSPKMFVEFGDSAEALLNVLDEFGFKLDSIRDDNVNSVEELIESYSDEDDKFTDLFFVRK